MHSKIFDEMTVLKTGAAPVFVVSVIAILVPMGHAFLMSAMLEVRGASLAIVPALILVSAAYLVWFLRSAREAPQFPRR
ncbi:MAG: hypothetical protein WBM03_03725 [Steroidobacteraceae bacterium]